MNGLEHEKCSDCRGTSKMNTVSKTFALRKGSCSKLLKVESNLTYPSVGYSWLFSDPVQVCLRIYVLIQLIRITFSSAANMAPRAPYICVPGVANFRDIGGYSIASQPGKETRRNVVFRSARPSVSLDPFVGLERGVKKLQMLAISHVYDLRSRDELTGKVYDRKNMLWPGTHRVSAPVFRPEEYSPNAVAFQFAKRGSSPEVSQIPPFRR
jgi:hypothetical protein